MSINMPEFSLPKNQEEIAAAAFKSAADPLMEAFQKSNEQMESQLGNRGIAFGGLGRNLRSEALGKQYQELGRISQGIGSSLGQSALNQAFQAAEAAKSREFQGSESALSRDLQRELQTGAQQFQSGESALDRALQRGLQTGAQQFQAGESALDRSLQRGLQTGAQQFQAGESALDRELRRGLQAEQLGTQVSESALDRALQRDLQTNQISADEASQISAQRFQSEQNLLNRDLQKELQEGKITADQASQLSAQRFTAGQNMLNRQAEANLAKAQQEWQSGEKALDRDLQEALQQGQIDANQALATQSQRFTAVQNEANRELQKSLQEGQINANMAQMMAQQNFTAQQVRDQRDLAAIESGAISGVDAQKIVGRLFGDDNIEFSNEEARNIASAARNTGLTVKEFENMRRTMGIEQMKKVYENPELFIDDPQRNLELNILSAGLSSGDPLSMAISSLSLLKNGYISEDAAKTITSQVSNDLNDSDLETIRNRFGGDTIVPDKSTKLEWNPRMRKFEEV